jgi:putative hydrolase of the HAD superfamily
MMARSELRATDWNDIRLVVFDVDGTLYSQRRLRALMTRDLVIHAARTRSLDAITVIRAYRRIREGLAERDAADFEPLLVAETAAATGRSSAQVSALVAEWIERRPLPHLVRSRYPGVLELFAGLKRKCKIVGIFSDYPAAAKLAALGLDADHIVCAGDQGIGALKPNPRGLVAILGKACVDPQRTVVIGDRIDRDGAAATQIGARALIRSEKPITGWQTFARFDDAIFHDFVTMSAR